MAFEVRELKGCDGWLGLYFGILDFILLLFNPNVCIFL